MAMDFQFVKAERRAAKLRLALCSPAGGGKTFSALKIAKGISGRIAMIDTEHGSGSLYAQSPGMPEYAVLEIDPPYSPRRYIEAIKAAEIAGFDIIIIDSLTHAWAGEGGVLEMHDKATSASRSGNSFTAWREITPEHNRLVDAILQSKSHIIATMRTKQEYAQTTDDKGKTIIKKLGTAPVQREGMDYEFTVVLDLTTDHIATSSKDRTSLFDGQHFKPDEQTGVTLSKWLNMGKPAEIRQTTVKSPTKVQTTTPAPEATQAKVDTKETKPLTAEQVSVDMSKSIKENHMTLARCRALLSEHGAIGNSTLSCLKSLSPENLVKVNEEVQNALKEIAF